MLTLKDMIKSVRMREQCGEMLDVALDRHDNVDHRNYIPPGVFREPLTPYDEAHGKVMTLSLHYQEHPSGDVTIVQN